MTIEAGAHVGFHHRERIVLKAAREIPPIGARRRAQGHDTPRDVDHAAGRTRIYQQRYTGHTTLRVIRVEKNEWEETNSNEQGPESRISITSYTPVYEYTVNGQRYEYHTRIGSSIDQYPIGKEYPGYYNPKNPADVTETLNDITGGGNRFFSLLFFGIRVLAITFALIRISAVITIL